MGKIREFVYKRSNKPDSLTDSDRYLNNNSPFTFFLDKKSNKKIKAAEKLAKNCW